MYFCDFQIKYDPWKDTKEDITKRIIYYLILRRINGRKPVVMFISGDSGEGKSWGVLRLQEILLECLGLDPIEMLNAVNVYTPIEYPKKLRALLFPKEATKDNDMRKKLKAANILAVHEARTLIKSKKWQAFTNQAVSDVNAMSRSIKRICFMIVSQFIRDITTDVRYTLTYYCRMNRPINRAARMYWEVMWKDDRDLEKPKLRKRKLVGVLVSPGGNYKKFYPKYIEMNKPSKEMRDMFEANEFESKGKIIHSIMEKMVKEIELEHGLGEQKIEAMVDWYTKDLDNLYLIGKTNTKGNWKIKKEVANMHDLTPSELREFESKLNTKLIKKGQLRKEEPIEDTDIESV